MSNNQMSTVKMSKIAIMIALSCVLVILIRIPYPPAPFLMYDPADIPIYITTFAFGPVAGLIVTLIVSLIQAFVIGDAGVYGFIMHVAATGAFVIVSGCIYRHKKTKKEAIIALITALIVMVVVMVIANYYITPIYSGMPREAVAAMLLPVIVPFNLLKGGINGLVTFLLYKHLSGFLHKDQFSSRRR